MSDKKLVVRCRPFTGAKMGKHAVIVYENGDVLVWDSVAQHYTQCHILSAASMRRIRQKAEAI